MFESDDGGLWIAAQDGVYRLAPAATRIERQTDAQSGPKGEVHAFAQAPDGRVWIGTSQRINRTQEDHKGFGASDATTGWGNAGQRHRDRLTVRPQGNTVGGYQRGWLPSAEKWSYGNDPGLYTRE
ncbi:MAG: hypothetical protein IPO43_06565 [Rhodoferax sp.]|nr:hypothetical protein [Rhodoferax sp.]